MEGAVMRWARQHRRLQKTSGVNVLGLAESVRSVREPKCEHGEHSIELDCPPGSPRPGDLIAGVIAGTGLPQKEECMKLFGNWKWIYDDVSCEEWDRIQPTIKERITALYKSGRIRYGSW